MPSEAELRALVERMKHDAQLEPPFGQLRYYAKELESLLASRGPEHPRIGSRIDVEHMAEAGHLRNADGSCDQCEPEQAARERLEPGRALFEAWWEGHEWDGASEIEKRKFADVERRALAALDAAERGWP